MSEVTITWRTYLDDLVRRMSPEEKRQLSEYVGVTRTTFLRWRTGAQLPRANHLEHLLAFLQGEQREQLRLLLTADPALRPLLPRETASASHISASFYADMLRLQRDASDRFWLLSSAILRHALSHLETYPLPVGIEIVLARCMPPGDDGKVQSLHEEVGMGTPPWRTTLHTKNFFLGAESLAGRAVKLRHGAMIPDLEDLHLVPTHQMQRVRSAAAYPLLRGNALAGAMIVSCTQPHYFTPERLALIEAYADLIGLAFFDHNFYSESVIDLRLLPPRQVQQAAFNTFRQRVEAEYRCALHAGETLHDLAQVEMRVRRALEAELLQAAMAEESVFTP